LSIHHFNLPDLALKVIAKLVKVVLSGLNHALVVFDFLVQLTNLVVLLLALVSDLEQRIVELDLTLVESLPHFFEHIHTFADGAERELVLLLETFQFFDFVIRVLEVLLHLNLLVPDLDELVLDDLADALLEREPDKVTLLALQRRENFVAKYFRVGPPHPFLQRLLVNFLSLFFFQVFGLGDVCILKFVQHLVYLFASWLLLEVHTQL
jgi:hypothetical protein